MDINMMHPRSGRVIKENGTIVNEADLATGVDVTFHDAATQTGNGLEFSVGGYKTLTLEIYGTAANTARTVIFYGKSASGTLLTIKGVRLSDFSIAASTTGKNELWQFDITGLYGVIMQLNAITGGSVTVKGRAVA